jgi:plasmid stability protein
MASASDEMEPVMIRSYEDQARDLLRAALAKNPDPGVQAINALCEPPLDAVLRVAALLEARDRKRRN